MKIASGIAAGLLLSLIVAFGQGLTLRDTVFVGASGTTGAAPAPGGNGQSTNFNAPSAYYTFDVLNGGAAIDAVAASNFSYVNFGGAAASTAGIISSAYDLTGGVCEHRGALFDFAAVDWCIRFWLQFAAAPGASRYVMDSSHDQSLFSLKRRTDNKLLFLVDSYSGTSSITNSTALSTGAWHRVVIWHKNTVGLGIKVDAGTAETNSYATVLTASASYLMTLENANGDGNYLDEMAVWKGYVPTETELTYDWNAGAGRTYPFP